MQAPANEYDLATIKSQRLANKIRYTIGVVSPAGVITEHLCEPHGNEPDGLQFGDSMVRWVNGEPQLSKIRRDEGYVLYEDLARADGELEIYANWKRAIEVRMRGGQIAGDVGGLYTSSIHERRRLAAEGNTSGQVFVVGHGVVSGEDAKKERVAALIASTGVGNPLTDAAPEPEPTTTRKGKP
jgi:hypothetical protein